MKARSKHFCVFQLNARKKTKVTDSFQHRITAFRYFLFSTHDPQMQFVKIQTRSSFSHGTHLPNEHHTPSKKKIKPKSSSIVYSFFLTFSVVQKKSDISETGVIK